MRLLKTLPHTSKRRGYEVPFSPAVDTPFTVAAMGTRIIPCQACLLRMFSVFLTCVGYLEMEEEQFVSDSGHDGGLTGGHV